MSQYTINLVAYTDAAFVEPMATMVRSVLDHLHTDYGLRLFVLESAVPDALKRRAESSWPASRIDVTWISCEPLAEFTEGYLHISATSYSRLRIGSLLPNDVERVVMLDSDVVVVADLGELWRTELGPHLALAVRDAAAPIVGMSRSRIFELEDVAPTSPYFNAGVLVLNLAQWRRDGLEEKLLALSAKRKNTYRLGDQCLLNVVLSGRWREMPPAWNQQAHHHEYLGEALGFIARHDYLAALDSPKIIHFCGPVKPWHIHCPHPAATAYFAARDRTAFAIASRPRMTVVGWLLRHGYAVAQQSYALRNLLRRRQFARAANLSTSDTYVTVTRAARHAFRANPVYALLAPIYLLFWLAFKWCPPPVRRWLRIPATAGV